MDDDNSFVVFIPVRIVPRQLDEIGNVKGH